MARSATRARIIAPVPSHRTREAPTRGEGSAPRGGVAPAVNHAFRGVFVPTPGRHVVKFEYWPAVLDRALNFALFGLIALAVSFWWWWRAGRRMPRVSAAEAEAAAPAAAVS